MILLNKRITATSLKQYIERLDAENLIKGIRNKKGKRVLLEIILGNIKKKKLNLKKLIKGNK